MGKPVYEGGVKQEKAFPCGHCGEWGLAAGARVLSEDISEWGLKCKRCGGVTVFPHIRPMVASEVTWWRRSSP